MQEQPQTPVSNTYYDLISTLYHELSASQTYAAYSRDAQSSGDHELNRFFQQAQQVSNQCAEQARTLLTNRISASSAAAMGGVAQQPGERGAFGQQPGERGAFGQQPGEIGGFGQQRDIGH